MRARRRDDSGATLVEAAFALPIFFLILLGLIDFGMMAFDANRASNAARDGARVGIINYRYLDAPASDPKAPGAKDFDLLKAAIQQNLPNRTIQDADLDVRCITPGGADTPCLTATVDVDRVSVTLDWQRESISPVSQALGFASVDISGTARMTIVGSPVGGAVVPPPPCDNEAVSVSPSTVTRTAGGQLQSDLTITVTATGSCTVETLRLVAPNGSTASICNSGCVGTFTYGAATNSFWTAGTATAELRNGTTVVASRTFTVNDPAPPACNVSGISVSPNPVNRNANGTLASNLLVNVAGTGSCTNLTVELVAPNGSVATVCGPATCALGNNGYLATTNNFWTAGTATARVRNGAPIAATTTFTVNNAPCSVTLTIGKPSVGRDGQNRLQNNGGYRQRVTVNTSGVCGNLTVAMTTPSGANTVTLCTGAPCTGNNDYNAGDQFWTAGTATVSVSGAGAATTTFQVT